MGIVLELIHKIVLVQIYALQKIVLDPILKLPKKNPRDLLEIHQEVDLQITTRDVRDWLPLVGQRSHDLIQLRGCVSVIKKLKEIKGEKEEVNHPLFEIVLQKVLVHCLEYVLQAQKREEEKIIVENRRYP